MTTSPYLSHPARSLSQEKNLLKRVAVLPVLARIKKVLPVKHRIIVFNASIKPILKYCVSVWRNCRMQDYWMRFFNFKNGVRVLYWVLYFRLEPCHYFWNLSGYPSIKSVFKEDYLCSRKSWIYVHRISSLRNCYL